MRFIPDYRVCYKGRFYEADEAFEIDPSDKPEMSAHGEVVDDPTPPTAMEERVNPPTQQAPVESTTETSEKKPKRRGRPPKEGNNAAD